METKISFVNQGTYGCVYRNDIECANKESLAKVSKSPYAPLFVSKVMKADDLSERRVRSEILIGALIKEMPSYKYHFAPIESHCPIKISQIEHSEIEKCDLFQNTSIDPDSNLFVSHKVRYVGHHTVEEYLLTKVDSPRLLQKRLLECHIHIQESIIMLGNANIVHYDIKSNNVMYDDMYGVPIVIDFGLSFDSTKISSSYHNEFYAFYEKYPPWCIEIVWISYLIEVGKDDLKKLIPVMELKASASVFVTENPAFRNIASQSRIDYINRLRRYIDEHSKQTYKEFIDKLIKENAPSWNNYSVTVMMSDFIEDIKSLLDPVLYTKYDAIIKEVILTFPNRASPRQTIDNLLTLGEYHDVSIANVE